MYSSILFTFSSVKLIMVCVNDLLMVIWLQSIDPDITYTPLRDHPPENFLNLQESFYIYYIYSSTHTDE